MKKLSIFLQSVAVQSKTIFEDLKKSFSLLKRKKFPKFSQWKQVFKILGKKEKKILSAFLLLFVSSSLFLIIDFYFERTEIRPAVGGSYSEAMMGRPRFINPIYASSNDADRDLTELLFSGLMKYDKDGKIVPDLAESYRIEEDGKVYEFTLKSNIIWHDGEKFSADDVIFTIKTIQNSDYKSPLRSNWLGVETEKINDKSIRFSLKGSYPAFLENATLKILPEHIWKNIPAQNFPLAVFNLQPVGTGPYRFKNLTYDNLGYIKSVEIIIFPRYFGKKPYVPEINFYYFDSENAALSSLKKGELKGLAHISPENYQSVGDDYFSAHPFSLPRYFAVFLNPKEAKIFQDKNIRLALNYGTDKNEILNQVFSGFGKIIDSPVLPDVFGGNPPSKIYEFSQDKAKSLLDKSGYKDENNDIFREKTVENVNAAIFKSNLLKGSQGIEVRELQKCLAQDPEIYPEGEVTGLFGDKTDQAVIKFQEKYRKEILEPSGLTKGNGQVKQATRAKLNELCSKPPSETTPLQISISTVDQPQMIEIANNLQKQWADIGIKTQIKIFEISKLQQEVIKPRAYESLLFGEVLGTIPDPFSFWHSSQKKDPGLNLADYDNKSVDKLLEEARQNPDETIRAQKYEKFQDLLIEDAPVIFLYSPDYLYLVSKEIKGISGKIIADPSKRLAGIEDWYIKTKRVWK